MKLVEKIEMWNEQKKELERQLCTCVCVNPNDWDDRVGRINHLEACIKRCEDIIKAGAVLDIDGKKLHVGSVVEIAILDGIENWVGSSHYEGKEYKISLLYEDGYCVMDDYSSYYNTRLRKIGGR